LGAVYLIAMSIGAFGYRIPPLGWQPARGAARARHNRQLMTSGHVHVNEAVRTPQFWLLWSVLCLNVSAGIGVIGMASPMLQEVFGGQLLQIPLRLSQLSDTQRAEVATIGAAFAGLLSLFNIAGRIFWASLSDFIGRKLTYAIFFVLGMTLYVSAPLAGAGGHIGLFVAIFCAILTMYGGGFATIPAYLSDIFGTHHVGAIHGRLLTAWSVAGILGPVVVNYIREFQLANGVPPHQAYNITMYLLAAMLLAGLCCNAFVRPVRERHHMGEEQLAAERAKGHSLDSARQAPESGGSMPAARSTAALALAWAAIAIPLAWALWITLTKSLALFR
jgi:MFS family permease